MRTPLEVVREGYDRFNRRDFDGMVAVAAPDAVWADDTLPGLEPVRGREAIREYLDRLMEAWADLQVDITRLEEVGEGVLVVYRLSGRGRTSGLNVCADAAAAIRVEDGMVATWHAFPSERAARDALSTDTRT